MKELQGIFKVSDVIGRTLIQGVIYQVFFLLYSLKGLLIMGIFPSLAAVFQSIYNQIKKGESIDRKDFHHYYHEYFKIGNQLGFTFLGLIIFLWIDLRVSAIYLQVPLVHFILLLFLIVTLGTSLYVFPSLCRYDLTYKQYVQRANLLFIYNLVETIAMIVGIIVGTVLVTFFPILIFVSTIPIFIFPIVWFSIQGMEKAERKVADR